MNHTLELPSTQRHPSDRTGLTMLELADDFDTQPPTCNTGPCYSCDCRGYVKGPTPNWCGNCKHHWDRHR